METNVAMLQFAEEAGAGDPRDADLFDEPTAGVEIGREAEARNIDEHVISTFGVAERQTGLAKITEEQLALAGVFLEELRVVAVRQFESGDGGLLQRRGRADGEEIVHRARLLDYAFGSHHVTETPAGD